MQSEYLHDDGSIDVQIRGIVSRKNDEGYNITIDVCSKTSQLTTELYTYSDKDGFYRVSPDETPQVVNVIDGLLTNESIQRNPSDCYEISIEVTSSPQVNKSSSKRHISMGVFPSDQRTQIIDEILESLEKWEQSN